MRLVSSTGTATWKPRTTVPGVIAMPLALVPRLPRPSIVSMIWKRSGAAMVPNAGEPSGLKTLMYPE